MITKRVDNDIVKWSEKAFPDLTMEKELVKLEEEISELLDSVETGNEDEIIKEVADVYIVARILRNRFKSHLGGYFCGWAMKQDGIKLYEAVKNKMEINKARKWEKVNGVFKHKEN